MSIRNVLTLFAITIMGLLLTVAYGDDAAGAGRMPNCPETWPDATGWHGDWYVIISEDSNGNKHGRAYPADSDYRMGYAPGATHEICIVRIHDNPGVEQVTFQEDREPKDTATQSGAVEPPPPPATVGATLTPTATPKPVATATLTPTHTPTLPPTAKPTPTPTATPKPKPGVPVPVATPKPVPTRVPPTPKPQIANPAASITVPHRVLSGRSYGIEFQCLRSTRCLLSTNGGQPKLVAFSDTTTDLSGE